MKSQKGLKFAIQDQKQSKTKISQEYIKKLSLFLSAEPENVWNDFEGAEQRWRNVRLHHRHDPQVKECH